MTTSADQSTQSTVQHYELLTIIPATYAADELPAALDKVRATLREHGATLTYEEDMGKRRLAYPINRVHHGHYLLIEFNADPAKAAKLDTALKLMPEVLRAMLITKPLRSADELAREKSRRDESLRAAEEPTTKTVAEASLSGDGEFTIERKKEREEAPATADGKVSMEELDKKLDELIDESII